MPILKLQLIGIELLLKLILLLDRLSAKMKGRGPGRKWLRHMFVAGKHDPELKNMPLASKGRIRTS